MCPKENIKKLEKDINYSFKNKEILLEALTHSSYANEQANKKLSSNERLEFLGDSVVNLVITEFLYKKEPDWEEGDLTKERASMICESSLAYIGKSINLGDYLFLGIGEEKAKGRDRESTIANAFEALVGAVYLDSNFESAKKMILENFKEDITLALDEGSFFVDYKTSLQELVQKKEKVRVQYKLLEACGPDHDKTFIVEVSVRGKSYGVGKGKNKKDAEQEAAKITLEIMEREDV